MYLKSRFSQISILALALLLALATLALALPRFQAAYRFLPVDIAIGRYYESLEIPSHRMLTLVGFANQSLELHEHCRFYDGLAQLQYLRGLDIYTPALERRAAYRESEAQTLLALESAPAQPEAWMRVALVRSILRDEPETVLEPWKMSVFTGRTHSTLVVPRAGLGMMYLELMDSETRAMLRDQLLLAWQLKPGELLLELKQRDPLLDKTRSLISAIDPSALQEMESRLEKVR